MISLVEENNIAIIKLNRPEKRNAFHPNMVNQISDAIAKISADKRTKALIITGEGSSFCAGADLEYLSSMQNYSSIENEKDSENLAEMFLSIYKLPIPTIAAVNGPAIAGGCGLASVCDFIVADTERAKFGYTEVKIGFIPAIISIFLIRKIGYENAKKLFLTGDLLTAKAACEKGLVDEISNKVLEDSILFAKKVISNSLSSYAVIKSMMNDIRSMSVNDAVNYCIQLNTLSRSTEDFKEGIKKFLNKSH